MDQASGAYRAGLQASGVAEKVPQVNIARTLEMAPVARLRSPVPEPDAHSTRLAVGPRVIGNSRYPDGRDLRISFARMHSAVETDFPPCARRSGLRLSLQYDHAIEEIRL
jgi:hypothetical protein